MKESSYDKKKGSEIDNCYQCENPNNEKFKLAKLVNIKKISKCCLICRALKFSKSYELIGISVSHTGSVNLKEKEHALVYQLKNQEYRYIDHSW